MGHAMRSRVMLDELIKRHDVQVVVSGRAYDYLEARVPEQLAVKKIWGYSIVYEDNEVQNFKTLLQNVKGAVSAGRRTSGPTSMSPRSFEPDVVISDFESWSYLFAKSHGLPVISVDNMQIIDPCTHAPEIIEGLAPDFRLTKAIVKAKVPGAFHYYITTFFYPPTRKSGHLSASADFTSRDLGGAAGGRLAPAGVSDVDVQPGPAGRPEGLRARMSHLRPAARPDGGRRRGQSALPAVQRDGLRR